MASPTNGDGWAFLPLSIPVSMSIIATIPVWAGIPPAFLAVTQLGFIWVMN
jgi:hypothetical protein